MSDFSNTDLMEESVSFYRNNAKIKSNGIIEVSKGDYMKRLDEAHGVTKEMLTKVNQAVDFESTAAARYALEELEGKIESATPEDMKNEGFRRDLRSTVRLPTHGGATEVTVVAESFSTAPVRAGEEPREPKATYGRTKTTINTKLRIDRNFHTEADERMRKALGISASAEPAMADVD